MSLTASNFGRSGYTSGLVPVLNHPLQPDSYSKSKKPQPEPADSIEEADENGVSEFSDPLGVQETNEIVENLATTALHDKRDQFINNGNILFTDGPLLNTLAEKEEDVIPDLDPVFVGLRPWGEFKDIIHETYKSENTFSLESSFLKPTEEKGRNTRPHPRNQKAQPVNGHRFTNLTEEDFNRKIRDLRRILRRLWAEEERIECIKLCREVANILTQSNLGYFYPKAFVLVTDFMDIFGHLVYERLLEKAKAERRQASLPTLPTHFQTIDVLEKTRIVARNWFGKLSEIREILPHLYIGGALMPIMKFMDDTSIAENLLRLCQLAATISHPLIASYARCFICRVAMRCEPSNRAPHWKCLNDWMQTFKEQPVILLWPPLEYVIQCVAYNAVTYDDILPLWEYAKLPEKRPFVFKALLNALPTNYLTEFSLETCKILMEAEEPKIDEITAFGKNILKGNVAEINRKPLLKAIWKMLNRLETKDFLEGMRIWIEFVAKYFTVSEIQVVLDGICGKVENDRAFNAPQSALLEVLSKILGQLRDIPTFLTLPVFSNFTSLFTDDSIRKQMSVQILETMVSKHKLASISDLNLAYQVSDVCKILHDSLDLFSSDEEVFQAVELIKSALNRFEVKADPENALSFYVACRANLLNLDECQKYVIDRILELAIFVIKSAKFSVTRSAFVHACIANTFITIPSLSSRRLRLDCALKSTKVALSGQAFLQVDSFVDLLFEEFTSIQNLEEIAEVSNEFLAMLVVIPKYDEERYCKWIGKWMEVVQNNPSTSSKSPIILSTLQFFYSLKINRSSTLIFHGISKPSETLLTYIDALQKKTFELAQEIVNEESEKRPNFSLNLLEFLSIFVGKVDENAHQTAKAAFKKAKRSPDPKNQARLNAIHFN
ncbi:unnamed protein product [Bursaphelenchus xylophilus]|uniref:(pine wood nematode) hypothetical protein n=1 Tax=Bursaphelenchus xylophilus TaxID=6326 RepID=A0A1I7SV51_BURXY|nr:unnamed protein product [Bursaphelenchus xylophilus]CAG9100906.1 unnamed protein product [Bursaphelenchus xylophilus]